jgi:alpha-L-fucosidase
MKKIYLLLCILIIAGMNNVLFAQQDYQPTEANLQAREDFQDRKFGLFIHWGIYSILGDGEWVMHNENIPYKDYSKLASFFYPMDFNAKEWVALAKAAGMKYITITARHHDGFSMFGTKASPYNVVDATPWHTDPMKELAEECHKQGIKLFFYYSLLDWGRPDYGFGHPIINGKPEDADWDHYIAFMKQQLTELLTNYGPIGGIWFDGEWERESVNWHLDEIYALIHKLQPQALIGNNHHHAPEPGQDFQMFERDLPGGNSFGWNSGGVSKSLPLESCQTLNDSWGFTIKDNDYKSVKQVIDLLVNDAGRNSNLLLNVGPMPNGKIGEEFTDTLLAVGKWMDKYGDAIYGTRGGMIPPQEWGVSTQKSGVQYLHILQFPKDNLLFIPGVKEKIKSAISFDTQQPVKFKQQPEGVFIYLDGMDPGAIDNIVELTFKS